MAIGKFSSPLQLLGVALLMFVIAHASPINAKIHRRTFVIKETSYTRLCSTKKILTVNGQFPGPTIAARKGDIVVVNVYNQGDYNITLHWHGVNQPRNPWSDGPEYITQCPIQPRGNFTYKIEFTEEEGTLWWHAHSDWDRATVHGAIVVHPKFGTTFPFPKPHKEIPIIIGEWWKDNVSEVIASALKTGSDPKVSDAFTINGQPGDSYPCSETGTFKTVVEYGKTYLLRVINAAMNNEVFFAIASHQITVVGTDGSYVKPFTTDYIMIAPGQTIDILLHADQCSNDFTNCRYYMAAHSFSDGPGVPFNQNKTTGILEYSTATTSRNELSAPKFPYLPNSSDDQAANSFTSKLRSLATKDYPIYVPKKVDKHITIAVAVNFLPCPNKSCLGPGNNSIAASLNNISFVLPSIDILGAYYHHINDVYWEGFPSQPPFFYNFTGQVPSNFTMTGRKVIVLEYNTNVEIVFQGTNIFGGENHPMHLHGYSFYVVGRGIGNFDQDKDPQSYNLVDPPYENTVAVPRNGWVAIRFKASNPGVWFMHCHLDRHASWGMETALIVKNGAGPGEQMLPPPAYMPSC